MKVGKVLDFLNYSKFKGKKKKKSIQLEVMFLVIMVFNFVVNLNI